MKRETSRHAAALALLGWYLITGDPPLPRNGWGIFESYDTAEECRKQKDKLIADVESKGYNKGEKDLATTFRHATCVATDDPRLKSK